MHGLTIPLGKLGFHIPRTLIQALSKENDSNATFHVQNPAHTSTSHLRPRLSSEAGQPSIPVPSGVYRIGRSIIRKATSTDASRAGSRNVSKHGTPRLASPIGRKDLENAPGLSSHEPNSTDESILLPPLDGEATSTGRVVGPTGRSIRFPDEAVDRIGPAERAF